MADIHENKATHYQRYNSKFTCRSGHSHEEERMGNFFGAGSNVIRSILIGICGIGLGSCGDISKKGDGDLDGDLPGDAAPAEDSGLADDGGNEEDTLNDTESATETEDICYGTWCNTPPPNECAPNGQHLVYNLSGWCELGECKYASYRESCPSGSCVKGVCQEAPCSGVSCQKSPPAECADEFHLKKYESVGVCVAPQGVGQCKYASSEIYCPDGCAAGQCINDPCAQVSCNSPPARYCSGNTMVLYDSFGYCIDGECRYDHQLIDCGVSGCQSGRCVNEDICARVSCDTPPANFCSGSRTLRFFSTQGVCQQGACLYRGEELICENGCVEGQCAGAPCVGIACDHPPSMYCKDNVTLSAWNGEAGICQDGACHYEVQLTPCAGECSAGHCSGAQCTGVYCKTPPADYCNGPNTRIQFSSEGACLGLGLCAYDSIETICENGCARGTCIGDYPDGSPCTEGDQCTSGYCADGYCCNKPCVGLCQRCNGEKSIAPAGTCSPIGKGYDPDDECLDLGLCTSACNGEQRCRVDRGNGLADRCLDDGEDCSSTGENAQCAGGMCEDGECATK